MTLDNDGESLTTSATATQTVVVKDTTAPVFGDLPPINLVADLSGNAQVTLTAPVATDLVDGDVKQPQTLQTEVILQANTQSDLDCG